MSWQLEPWNALVQTMREGEVRRVWLTLPHRSRPYVYDVNLASVVRTDKEGSAIIPDR
jgi:hypothetical protein